MGREKTPVQNMVLTILVGQLPHINIVPFAGKPAKGTTTMYAPDAAGLDITD